MSLAFASGELLTAAKMNRSNPLYKSKTGTQTATANAVVFDDTDLFLDLVAGRTYEVEAHIAANGTAAGDIKTVWSNTGTMNFPNLRYCKGPTIGTTNVLGTAAAATTVGVNAAVVRTMTQEVQYGVDGTNSSAIEETFTVECTASGRLQLRWAQAAASGATNVTSNSYLKATPIS